jgi:hypothetical protein
LFKCIAKVVNPVTGMFPLIFTSFGLLEGGKRGFCQLNYPAIVLMMAVYVKFI